MNRMTGAEFAIIRQQLGLTLDELAEVLDVNPRTTRSWEAGRDPIPARIPEQLAILDAEHAELAARMTQAGRAVGIVRDRSASTVRPRGWHVAAAARARLTRPDLSAEWLGSAPVPREWRITTTTGTDTTRAEVDTGLGWVSGVSWQAVCETLTDLAVTGWDARGPAPEDLDVGASTVLLALVTDPSTGKPRELSYRVERIA